MDERSRRPLIKAQRLAAQAARARTVPSTKSRESKLASNAAPGLIGRIRLAMIKKGLRRSEFARSIGASSSTVWYWFSSTRLPSDANLLKIAEALDVPLAWLLTGDPLLRKKP